jgi:hypothetical protein
MVDRELEKTFLSLSALSQVENFPQVAIPQAYLIEGVYKVVLQKLIAAQIRQLVPHYH